MISGKGLNNALCRKFLGPVRRDHQPSKKMNEGYNECSLHTHKKITKHSYINFTFN